MERFALAALAALTSLALASCAPAVFVGASTAGGVVAVDNRTVGSFIEDENIEISAEFDLQDEIGDTARYEVVSINRVAMLIGQAPNDKVRDRMETVVARQDNVRKVINKVEIAPQISLSRRAKDAVVTTRVKGELLKIQADEFNSLDVKVITEDAVVYLMGLITVENAALAIDTARNVQGVRQVIQAFEYIDQ